MSQDDGGYLMQILMQVGLMASRPDADKYRSAWDALKRIPQREGWLVSHKAAAHEGPGGWCFSA